MAFNKNVPKKSDGVSEWYNAIVQEAELAEYGPAKGTMIFRPYGFAIWEEIQKNLDADFKAHGVENAYFPMFIPESMLNKEKSHIEGFSPELAVVTIGGGEELKEKLIVRPTSETIIGASFSKWIKSWRDLPMMLNQWVNVVRWEKRTYMFMRTTEFLWQEGHTAHASHEDAVATQLWAMDTYEKTFKELFALPGYRGYKSDKERFAGAESTLTYEAMMPEGKALQSCTSHDLAQNFGKVFDIKFQNKNGENEFVWQTSWGLSTRSIGGLILAHGDDKGLRLPPRLAPIQVVLLPVRIEEPILKAVEDFKKLLVAAGVRVKIDDRDETIGFKINKWEVKGVPLRIEVGARELEAGFLKVVRRDTGEADQVAIGDLVPSVQTMLQKIQENLYAEAEQFLIASTHEVSDYEQFKKIMDGEKGFIKAFWCGDVECEENIKKETTATTRCRVEQPSGVRVTGKCVYCGKECHEQWYFAQAY